MITIRPARREDAAAVWSILEPTIREGETYALSRDMSEADALACWLGPDKDTFVAEEDGSILGTYFMRPNQAGPSGHVWWAFQHPAHGYLDALVMFQQL